MAIPKWNDERTDALTTFVGDESPISQTTVAGAAESLETSTRSVASKLRKLGYDVQKASAAATLAFTDEQKETLSNFLTSNSGEYTYVEIAAAFEDGAYSAKSIQGKILSMELTSHVKPAPKPESVRTYSAEEDATFIEMAKGGSSIEAIAEALGRPVKSVRGKALSLLRSEDITGIPHQETATTSSPADPFEGLDVASMEVEAIAEELGKTARGIKTMLTRRGLTASDYDGAAKKEKASA